MEFRTEFPIPKAPFQLSTQTGVLALGSCFAEVIGGDLASARLPVTLNPLGTLFDPLALFRLLDAALAGTPLDERLLYQREGRWVHHHVHSSVSGATPDELRAQVRTALERLRAALEGAEVLLLTLGTAWVQRLHEPPVYVANAHKRPARELERDLLSVKDVCKAFGALHHQLKTARPRLQTILTVSPVRHGRQAMTDNQVSKSVLRLACHYLTTDYADVHYFPAYELLLDDLRDYRFYADELLHPSPAAERYIAARFRETYFAPALTQFYERWQRIRQGLAHRPFHEAAPGYQTLLETLRRELDALPPEIDATAERAEVARRLEIFRS
jgi:hypothetical protein